MTNEQAHARFEAIAEATAPWFSHKSQMQADAELCYDILSDSVHWTDERVDFPEELEDDGLLMLRLLLRHRTCEMLGLPSQASEVWAIARAHFPEWAAFSSQRCHPPEDLLAMVRIKLAQGAHELDLLMRWGDRDGGGNDETRE